MTKSLFYLIVIFMVIAGAWYALGSPGQAPEQTQVEIVSQRLYERQQAFAECERLHPLECGAFPGFGGE